MPFCADKSSPQCIFASWWRMAKPITVKCFLSTFRNEGIEIRRFLYKNSNDPTISQLKDDIKLLYPQLREEKFELIYLGNFSRITLCLFAVVVVPITLTAHQITRRLTAVSAKLALSAHFFAVWRHVILWAEGALYAYYHCYWCF